MPERVTPGQWPRRSEKSECDSRRQTDRFPSPTGLRSNGSSTGRF